MTISQFMINFPDERTAINYFINLRYEGKVVCPYCNDHRYVYKYRYRSKVFFCKECNNTFSPFKNTIFEKSSTKLLQWFYVIHLVLNDKRGVSAEMLKREVGVTYKTAWKMLQKIRLAMGKDVCRVSFKGIVEVDEAYIGGKNRFKRKRNPKFGGRTDKTGIFGMKERWGDRIYLKLLVPNSKGETTTGEQLYNIIKSICKTGSVIISDEFMAYTILDKEGSGYIHKTINHSLGFSDGDGIHTNGIEGIWCNLKKTLFGTFTSISLDYLQRYLDEYCFRYNHKGKSHMETFDIVLKNCINL